MIGAPNARGQRCLVGVIQLAPANPGSDEITNIFRNYIIDIYVPNFSSYFHIYFQFSIFAAKKHFLKQDSLYFYIAWK